MAFKIADRVRESSSTTGTGAFTLTGAVTGFDTFASILNINGDTTWYCAQYGAEWEVGLGTRTSATVLARTTVLASSNADALVNFTAPPFVFITMPAAMLQYAMNRANHSGDFPANLTYTGALGSVGTSQCFSLVDIQYGSGGSANLSADVTTLIAGGSGAYVRLPSGNVSRRMTVFNDSGASRTVITNQYDFEGGGGSRAEWVIPDHGWATFVLVSTAFDDGSGWSPYPLWVTQNELSNMHGTLPVANGGTGVTSSTGTGNTVRSVSPAFTGTPTAPTAAAGTNTTQIATTAHVLAERTNAATLTNKSLTSPALTGTPTAPTATTGTNTTQVATTAFVQTELAALVDSSPGALNTLNELAAALGDDPNFATTVTNALAGKAALAGATFTGAVSAPSFSVAAGGNYSTLSPNGLTQAILQASDGGLTDLLSYLGSGGSYFRFISGDAGGNTVLGTWDEASLSVNGSINASGDLNLGWDRQVSFAYDADYFHRLNSAAGTREMQFLISSNDTRADFVWMNSMTGAANIAERMRLSVEALILSVRQEIGVNVADAALEIYNANTAGYGLRLRTAATGGEAVLDIRSPDDSASVARILVNGGIFGLSGTFSYGVQLDNNTGAISIKDGGGTLRRALLRATDQFVFGDVDNDTVDSYVTFCANLLQRHVIDEEQIGVWSQDGLAIEGVLEVSRPAGGAGLIMDASTGTADTGMDIRWMRGGVLKWQLGSGFATGGDSMDFYDRGGGDRMVWQAVSNGAFNVFVPTNVANDLTVSNGGLFKITDAPTSSAGLPAGTVWSDGGTLKLA